MSSTVLALDTAGHACSVAIVDPGGNALFSQSQWMARGHAAALAPLVQQALETVPGVCFDALAVTRGPGGFTGMRAGLAYARAFGLARQIPVYGFDVFASLRLTVGEDIPCLIDTRRNDFFYDGLSARVLNLPALQKGEIGILSGDEISSMSGEIAGSIWCTDYAKHLEGGKPETSGWIEPCPSNLAREAQRKLQIGESPDRQELSPVYVRQPSLGQS